MVGRFGVAIFRYTIAISERLAVGLQVQSVGVAGGGSRVQADRHGIVWDRGK